MIENIEDIDNNTEYYTVTSPNDSGNHKALLKKKSNEKVNGSMLKKSTERRVSFEEMDLTNK